MVGMVRYVLVSGKYSTYVSKIGFYFLLWPPQNKLEPKIAEYSRYTYGTIENESFNQSDIRQAFFIFLFSFPTSSKE